jgi:hypothetical protein
MPMDAFREGNTFTVCFDLPGVDPAKIDLHVERNVLSVRAERRPAAVVEDVEMQVFERPSGVFSSQLFLGDTLDTQRIEAEYAAGVLTSPRCCPCRTTSTPPHRGQVAQQPLKRTRRARHQSQAADQRLRALNRPIRP